jgi:hypothetical protein
VCGGEREREREYYVYGRDIILSHVCEREREREREYEMSDVCVTGRA